MCHVNVVLDINHVNVIHLLIISRNFRLWVCKYNFRTYENNNYYYVITIVKCHKSAEKVSQYDFFRLKMCTKRTKFNIQIKVEQFTMPIACLNVPINLNT